MFTVLDITTDMTQKEIADLYDSSKNHVWRVKKKYQGEMKS